VKTYDVVIVVAASWRLDCLELARRNLRVAVLDRQEMMHEASWRRRACFRRRQTVPPAIPLCRLDEPVSRSSKVHRCRQELHASISWRSSTATRRLRRANFKGNRAANDAATHDDNVVRFHDIILAAKARGATALDGFTSAILRVHWKGARFLRQILRANPVAGNNRFVAWLRKPLIFSTSLSGQH